MLYALFYFIMHASIDKKELLFVVMLVHVVLIPNEMKLCKTKRNVRDVIRVEK